METTILRYNNMLKMSGLKEETLETITDAISERLADYLGELCDDNSFERVLQSVQPTLRCVPHDDAVALDTLHRFIGERLSSADTRNALLRIGVSGRLTSISRGELTRIALAAGAPRCAIARATSAEIVTFIVGQLFSVPTLDACMRPWCRKRSRSETVDENVDEVVAPAPYADDETMAALHQELMHKCRIAPGSPRAAAASAIPTEALVAMLRQTASKSPTIRELIVAYRFPISSETVAFELEQWWWTNEIEEALRCRGFKKKLPRKKLIASLLKCL